MHSKAYCIYQLKCKCGPRGIIAPESWLGGRTACGSQELFPQRWEQSQVRVSLQVSPSCHCPGLAGGVQLPPTRLTHRRVSWPLFTEWLFFMRPVKPGADRGGMSLSSDSRDFDSMRTQLNLGGPLWRNNNNDKCTSVAGLKEAGRNVLLCWPVLTQFTPSFCFLQYQEV